MNFEEFLEKYQKVEVKEFPNSVPQGVLVSVCLQTYQHAPFIRECLDGILMQETDFDFEILLGEDDSADGTREICFEYANRYPEKIRLFLHSRRNNISARGKSTARFNLINNLFNARGELIALCEGDDYWIDPQKLQKQTDFLRANPDFAICAHRPLVLEDGAETPVILEGQRPEVSEFKDLARNGNYLPTPSVVFRNQVPEEGIPGYFLETEILDWPLHLQNSRQGKIRYLDEAMAVYRKHPGGMWSGKGFREHAEGMLRVIGTVSSHFEKDAEPYFSEYAAKLLSQKCLIKFAAGEFDSFNTDFHRLRPKIGYLPLRTTTALVLRRLLSAAPDVAALFNRLRNTSGRPS